MVHLGATTFACDLNSYRKKLKKISNIDCDYIYKSIHKHAVINLNYNKRNKNNKIK
jgi:hypothetical protein